MLRDRKVQKIPPQQRKVGKPKAPPHKQNKLTVLVRTTPCVPEGMTREKVYLDFKVT